MADDSRLEYFEGRVEEQSRNWDRLFDEVGRVHQSIHALGAVLTSRIDDVQRQSESHIDALDLKLDRKIDAVGQKLDRKIDAVDQKLDRKIDDLRADLAKQFRWTIGVMVALATGVLTAVLTR